MDESIINQLRDPVFKGCTRPAMLMGVPLVPLVVVFGLCFIAGMWGLRFNFWLAPFFFVVLLVLVMVMRQITRKDDQRLNQWKLRFFMRVRNRNKSFWGATSYSANRYKRRK